jgi:hypothetical protein
MNDQNCRQGSQSASLPYRKMEPDHAVIVHLSVCRVELRFPGEKSVLCLPTSSDMANSCGEVSKVQNRNFEAQDIRAAILSTGP